MVDPHSIEENSYPDTIKVDTKLNDVKTLSPWHSFMEAIKSIRLLFVYVWPLKKETISIFLSVSQFRYESRLFGSQSNQN